RARRGSRPTDRRSLLVPGRKALAPAGQPLLGRDALGVSQLPSDLGNGDPAVLPYARRGARDVLAPLVLGPGPVVPRVVRVGGLTSLRHRADGQVPPALPLRNEEDVRVVRDEPATVGLPSMRVDDALIGRLGRHLVCPARNVPSASSTCPRRISASPMFIWSTARACGSRRSGMYLRHAASSSAGRS